MEEIRTHCTKAMEGIGSALNCAVQQKSYGVAMALMYISGLLDCIMRAQIEEPAEGVVTMFRNLYERQSKPH